MSDSSLDTGTGPRRGPQPRPLRRRTLLLESAAVAACALALRVPGLRHEPWGDELYHILAARQYLETGVFGIAGGVYARDPIYSHLVAGLYRVFGESPLVARLPALAAGVLTIVIVFAMLRRHGERLAAWVAALVLVATPALIEQAQYARSYPLQQLCIVISAAAVARLVRAPVPSPISTVLLAMAAAGSLVAGLQFQPLTMVAAAGLATGALLAASPFIVRYASRRAIAVTFIAAAGGAFAAVVMAWQTGALDRIASLATYSDMWAARNRQEVRFYHWLLLEDFPTAWSLFPIVVLLALLRAPRIAAMAASVFVVAFVTHSLLAWKAERYFSYALPFFAILVGLAIAEAVPFVRQALRRLVPGESRTPHAMRLAIAAGLVAFLIGANHAFVASLRLAVRDPAFLYPGGPTPTLSWSLARPSLEPVVRNADVVVSTEDLEAIYYLGRLDYVLDRDHLRQGGLDPEFTMDPRIRTRMIGETSSLRRVIDCHPSGVLIAMRWALRSYKMAPETAELIRRELEEVQLPPSSGLVAYRWHSSENPGRRCPNHESLTGRHDR